MNEKKEITKGRDGNKTKQAWVAVTWAAPEMAVAVAVAVPPTPTKTDSRNTHSALEIN